MIVVPFPSGRVSPARASGTPAKILAMPPRPPTTLDLVRAWADAVVAAYGAAFFACAATVVRRNPDGTFEVVDRR